MSAYGSIDNVRRDLKHADGRYESAAELRKMAAWIRACPNAGTVLAYVPEHTSIFGTRHKRRDMTLTEEQRRRLVEFLEGEAKHLEHHAKAIEDSIVRAASEVTE